MIRLALRTGIGMSEWELAGDRAVATAIDELQHTPEPEPEPRFDEQGRQMSG